MCNSENDSYSGINDLVQHCHSLIRLVSFMTCFILKAEAMPMEIIVSLRFQNLANLFNLLYRLNITWMSQGWTHKHAHTHTVQKESNLKKLGVFVLTVPFWSYFWIGWIIVQYLVEYCRDSLLLCKNHMILTHY